jgi:type III pantothenate kinase
LSNVVLTIDVGNSHTVIGIFRNEAIAEYWRLTTRPVTTSDEVFLRINGLIMSSSVAPHEITHIGLASVVPALERIWAKALGILLRKPVAIVSSQNCLGLKINYDYPTQLGADRICNVLGLKERGFKNGIVVDLGTATTFDILKEGGFYGGVIMPGINSSLEILIEKAVMIPQISLSWTDKIVATNTEDAIRSGILNGFLGQLEFMIRGIKAELGDEDFKVVATGGWSTLLQERVDIFMEHDHFLTLKGIKAVALNGIGE